jgi:hypothetical protein
VTAVKVLDATLRDGSHAVRHALTPDQVTRVAAALDRAGVYAVGVGHGDGIGGSSVHLGRASHPDAELWRAAAAVLEHARLAVTLVPVSAARSTSIWRRTAGRRSLESPPTARRRTSRSSTSSSLFAGLLGSIAWLPKPCDALRCGRICAVRDMVRDTFLAPGRQRREVLVEGPASALQLVRRLHRGPEAPALAPRRARGSVSSRATAPRMPMNASP